MVAIYIYIYVYMYTRTSEGLGDKLTRVNDDVFYRASTRCQCQQIVASSKCSAAAECYDGSTGRMLRSTCGIRTRVQLPNKYYGLTLSPYFASRAPQCMPVELMAPSWRHNCRRQRTIGWAFERTTTIEFRCHVVYILIIIVARSNPSFRVIESARFVTLR